MQNPDLKNPALKISSPTFQEIKFPERIPNFQDWSTTKFSLFYFT